MNIDSFNFRWIVYCYAECSVLTSTHQKSEVIFSMPTATFNFLFNRSPPIIQYFSIPTATFNFLFNRSPPIIQYFKFIIFYSNISLHFLMSQFPYANSPYMIFGDTSPFGSQNSQLPDGSQPYDIRWHEGGEESDCPSLNDISEQSQEEPPAVQSAENNQDVIFTNTTDLRSVLATLSHYNHGQLGTHLKSFRGLLILPLDAVTALRTPNSNHCLEYPCLVFYPHQEFSTYQTSLPNFIESIQNLYPS